MYPVIIREFSRRHGSGGAGRYTGGDGCVRDIEFTTELDVSILSQRRVVPPYGMAGGEPGACGVNHWYRKVEGDGEAKYTVINLGGSNQCVMRAGDRIVLNTPGGGGYGAVGSEGDEKEGKPTRDATGLARATGSLAAMRSAQHTN